MLLKASDAKGTALIIHGLNFDAEGMRALAEVFQAQGFDAFAPRLFAHRGNKSEMERDARPHWERQFEGWQALIEGPLICVGYSLGALLVLEQHLKGHLKCSLYFGFSPALILRTPDWVIESARAILPQNLQFPSAIPYHYRHFDLITLKPTYALFDTLKSFRQVVSRRLDSNQLKGMIVIDPLDEVIDAVGTADLVLNHLPRIKVIRLQAKNLDEKHAHHILIDPKHVGDKQWKSLRREIQNQLQSLGE